MIFQRLSKEQIKRIVDLQVAQLVERVRERGVEVELTDGARSCSRTSARTRPTARAR